MEIVLRVLDTPEFWIVLSVVAAALPGPQTRLFPHLFRAVAAAIRRRRDSASGESRP